MDIRKMLAHEALKAQWVKSMTVDERSSAIGSELDQKKRDRKIAKDKTEATEEKKRDRHADKQKQHLTQNNQDRSDQPAVHNPYLDAYVSSTLDLGREAKRARPSSRPSSAANLGRPSARPSAS